MDILKNSFVNWTNSLNKNRFALSVCIVFSLILGFGMYHHEMWRDEYEWFLFRKHNGIFDPNDPCYNFYNILCCAAIWFKPTLFSFQILHFLIILGAAAAISFLSPFSNLEKILISLGYFFVYEYGVITRPYSLVTLVSFLITYEICRDKRRYWILAFLILILEENNPLSLILACGFVFYISIDLLINRNARNYWKDKQLITGFSIFIVGSLLVGMYYAIYLPKVAPIVQYKGGTPPMITMVNQIWNSYVPIPDLTQKVRFWWSNIFNFQICYPPGYSFGLKDITVAFAIPFVASILILTVIITKFSKKPLVCCTYVVTTFLMGVFLQHFMKCYTIRYIGFLYVIFIFCYWIFTSKSSCDEKVLSQIAPKAALFYQNEIKNKKWFLFANNCFPLILYFILASQVFAGFYALSKDFKYKFSHSKDLAEYIKWNNYQNTHTLVGYPDYTSECLGAILESKVYFPQTEKFNYHDDAYNPTRKKVMPLQEVIEQCVQFTEDKSKPVILILNFPIMENSDQILSGPAMITPKTSIKLVKDFPDEVICGDEVYWVYELKQVK